MPLNELASEDRIAGRREVRRALSGGLLKKLFFALDADDKKLRALIEDAVRAGVETESAESCVKLGRACAIDRPASVAGLRSVGSIERESK